MIYGTDATPKGYALSIDRLEREYWDHIDKIAVMWEALDKCVDVKPHDRVALVNLVRAIENYKLALSSKDEDQQFMHHSVQTLILKKLPENWQYLFYLYCKHNQQKEGSQSLLNWLKDDQLPYMKKHFPEKRLIDTVMMGSDPKHYRAGSSQHYSHNIQSKIDVVITREQRETKGK